MIRTFRLIGLVALAVALAVVPSAALAAKGGQGKSQGTAKSCKAVNKAFVVKGTLVSFTADDPLTTGANEASVTLTVTKANRHARNSGDLVDADPATDGTQVTYSAATDEYKLALSGYDDAADTPSPGDKVKVTGKVAYTKKRCAPAGTSLEDRYGDVNVKRVKLVDKD